ncbi:hypothetical protein CCO03_17095 [Comamonas serinivorans]|uniref:Uncharacterized protein n=1 Tax=Comamonas serinivorans TaxID=1082851 RepID=A0A1Y0ERD0_9BURK|nr:hypothetical protein [Comamonas serinivorans]ARU06163.1 hypothetical protein CCO03_17095 [Comamonas serinivorans]
MGEYIDMGNGFVLDADKFAAAAKLMAAAKAEKSRASSLRDEGVVIVVASVPLGATNAAVPDVAAVAGENDLAAGLETRLAEVMRRARGAVIGCARQVVAVGPEVTPRPFGEVVQDIERTIRLTCSELSQFFGECVDARLRRVELLNHMQVGSLHVEKPFIDCCECAPDLGFISCGGCRAKQADGRVQS